MIPSPVDLELSAVTADGRVPGVVAGVTDRHGIIYRGAFGVANVGTREPLHAGAVFRIASMTKLVTSIVVLQLQERGVIDLDAPFARCYPGFRQPRVLRGFDPETFAYETAPAQQQITVRELLTHTAGFGYWFLNPELKALMGDGEPEYYDPPFLMHPPGTRFQYGISTDVLGQAIPPLQRSTLEETFAEQIFGPLGMRDTSFRVPAETWRLASLHRQRGRDGFEALGNEIRGEPPRGGGGLYSTVDDYLALLRMLLNGGRVGSRQLLAPETVAEIQRNQIGSLIAERQTTAAPERTADFAFMDGTQKFGLGVLIDANDRPEGRAAGSYGWAGIFNTYFWVDPAADLAAVVCMQLSPFCAPECLEVCDRFERALYRQLRFRT